jgi:hypothetical protein
MKVSGVSVQVSGQRRHSYETPSDRNCEQIKRRTSNAQLRTLNIDDAALYLIKNHEIKIANQPLP